MNQHNQMTGIEFPDIHIQYILENPGAFRGIIPLIPIFPFPSLPQVEDLLKRAELYCNDIHRDSPNHSKSLPFGFMVFPLQLPECSLVRNESSLHS